MRNNKILSLLLSATLAISSLPMAFVTAGAAEAAAPVNYASDLGTTMISAADSNMYLHVAKRVGGTDNVLRFPFDKAHFAENVTSITAPDTSDTTTYTIKYVFRNSYDLTGNSTVQADGCLGRYAFHTGEGHSKNGYYVSYKTRTDCLWRTESYSVSIPKGETLTGMGLNGYSGGDRKSPFDLDGIWVEDADGNILWSVDFSETDINTYLSTVKYVNRANADVEQGALEMVIMDDTAYAHDATVAYTNDTSTTDSVSDKLPAGLYQLTADVRYGYYTNANDGSEATTVNVTAKFGTNDVIPVASDATVTRAWTTVNSSYINLNEEISLEEVKFTSASGKPIDVKNLKFVAADVETEKDLNGEQENLFDGAKMTANGNITDHEVNTYLYLGTRDNAGKCFFGVKFTDEAQKVGDVYDISFKIKLPDGDTIDSIYSLSAWTGDSVPSMIGDYIKKNQTATTEWKTVTARYTVGETPVAMFGFRGGQSGATSVLPLILDDFTITKNDATIASVNFESTDEEYYVARCTSETQTTPVITEISTTLGANTGDVLPATVTWDVANLDLTKGSYNFTADVASAVEGNTAWVEYYLTGEETPRTSPATVIGKYNDFTSLNATLRVTGNASIEKIVLKTDVETSLYFKNATLYGNVIPEGGLPNIGILMVLLAKKELAERTTVEIVTTEYVKNGSFDEPATISDEVKEAQTTADEGWWTRINEKHTTTLTQMTEDGNSFLRIGNVSDNGVFYNTGVVVQPGTYELSVDLRVYESDPISLRTFAINPDDMSIYFDSKALIPVDTHTKTDKKGQSVGYSKEITDEWTTYTDTIVLEKETLLIVSIRRGPSSDYRKNFDIDNLSITKTEEVITIN